LYLGIDELYRFVGEKGSRGVWTSWGNEKGEGIFLLPLSPEKRIQNLCFDSRKWRDAIQIDTLGMRMGMEREPL